MWRCRASNQSSRLTNFFLNSEIKYGWKNCRISTVSIPPLTPPPKLTSSVAFTPTLSHTRYRSTNFNINSRKSIQCGITLSTWSNLSNVGPRFTNTRLYTTRQYSTGNDKNSNNTGHSRINFKYSWDFKAFFSKFRRIFSFFKKGKPLTADHIFAIFSWAVFGTTFWVVVGTTTLLSSVLWIVNTLRFQEWVALRVGAYLTKQSGVHISFESAVGNWKQGTIRVQNVILAREGLSEVGQSAIYLTIDRMDVKISLLWMLEGKGILRACKASGVRGFVDRRPEAIFYSNNPNYTPPNKRTLRRGDLEMENLSVSDLLIQLYLPDPTSSRPHPVSIYTLECDQFRNHWLFLDLLSAKSVVGKFDGCLFTFGIPQKEDITHTAGKLLSLERELKINGVPMSLLSKTATGPLNWIKEGTLDISLSITLPSKESNARYKEMVVARQTQAQVQTQDVATTQEMGNLSDVNREAEEDSLRLEDTKESDMDTGMGMEMRFDVMFNHLRVSAPLYTPELSYLNNAVVHPILAYMNSHSKHIPLSFDVRLDMAGLDGARTPAEAGLWLALSSSVALEFSRLVHDTQTTETLRSVANTLLKDCWGYLTGWLYTPS